MDGISTYILRHVASVMLFVTLCVTMAIWLTQSLRFVDMIVNRGLPVTTFLYLAMLLLPRFLIVVLPIALFASVLFTYNKLTMDSELVVCRAVGISQLALAVPALVLAGAVVGAVYAMNVYFLPASYRAFKDLQWDIKNAYSNLVLHEGQFNEVSNGVVVYVRRRAGDGDLRGVLVHDMRKPDHPVTLMAESGALIRTENQPRVLLLNGNRQEIDRPSNRVSMLYFDRYTIDMSPERVAGEGRWREPRERFLPELFFPDNSPADRQYRKQIIAEGHNRIVSPWYAITYALVALAALLYGDFDRRGQARRILVASAAVALLQAGQLALLSLGARSTSAYPAMYALCFAPMAVALWFIVKRPRPVAARPVPA